ncbi:MAG: glutathione S-transferase family protein [Endozoicomonas sp. (ex Botrylloides leachii)]|nr:glutathione S-transferase family protein [Endozoicomonas sp. (ex Botrylloides leachii)]
MSSLLTLNMFPVSKRSNIPNISPFCVKIETCLRILNIPYDIFFIKKAPRYCAPKGKLPFIDIDGQRLGDSEIILKYLAEKKGLNIDKNFSEKEMAAIIAYKKMLDEHVSFIMSYYRWGSNRYWKALKKFYFPALSAPIRFLWGGYMRYHANKYYYAQGISRHSESEIDAFFDECLFSLSQLLGEKDYFFDNTPSSLDAAAFGFLCNIYRFRITKHLTEIGEKYPNLKAHSERMMTRYFPERG